jgi:thioredoxin-related protein
MEVILFTSETCSPCKNLKRQVNFSEYSFVKEVDVVTNQDIVDKYSIGSIPTLLFLDNNDNEIVRYVGSVDPKTIIKSLEDFGA